MARRSWKTGATGPVANHVHGGATAAKGGVGARGGGRGGKFENDKVLSVCRAVVPCRPLLGGTSFGEADAYGVGVDQTSNRTLADWGDGQTGS